MSSMSCMSILLLAFEGNGHYGLIHSIALGRQMKSKKSNNKSILIHVILAHLLLMSWSISEYFPSASSELFCNQLQNGKAIVRKTKCQ